MIAKEPSPTVFSLRFGTFKTKELWVKMARPFRCIFTARAIFASGSTFPRPYWTTTRLPPCILVECLGNQLGELLIEAGFFVVGPTPVRDRIANERGFNHIIQLALVFKFFGMLPVQQCPGFQRAKPEQNQLILVYSLDHPPLYFMPDPSPLEKKPAIGPPYRSNQQKEE